jgi:ATP/maltotriose-dependent transcriptional regulator MalT
LDEEPQRARDEVEGSLSRWSNTGFYTQHFNAGVMLAQIDLYAGDAAAAAERLNGVRVLAKRSHLWGVEGYRTWHQHIAGCAALRTGNVDGALRAARRLEKDGANGKALAAALRAGASTEAGEHGLGSWQAAVKALSARDLQLQAACARLRIGDAGGLTWLEQQGVRNPTALADMLAPACSASVPGSARA